MPVRSLTRNPAPQCPLEGIVLRRNAKLKFGEAAGRTVREFETPAESMTMLAGALQDEDRSLKEHEPSQVRNKQQFLLAV